MGNTPEAVVAELCRSGRPVDGRRLTDWRTKDLLPPLVSRSLGRAGGKVYWWEDNDIVDRAMTVYDLLAIEGRADATLVSIWLMGFNVPAASLRKAWLRTLDKGTARHAELARRYGSCGDEEASHVLAEANAAGVARRIGWERQDAVPLTEEIAALMYASPTDSFLAGEEFKHFAKQFSILKGLPSDIIDAVSDVRVEIIIEIFRLVGTNEAMAALLRNASPTEFECAYSHWLRISTAIGRMMPDPPQLSAHKLVERGLPANIGRYVFPGLILCNSRGWTPQIEKTIQSVNRALNKNNFRALFWYYTKFGEIDTDGRKIFLTVLKEIERIWGFPDLASILTGLVSTC